jgi:hypothetical protein
MIKTVLVTADLGHLKAYRLTKQGSESGRPSIEVIQTESTDATSHLSEVVTDQAGQFRKGSFPSGPTNRSDGEPHNLALERRRRALKAIARDISRLIAREKPQEWILAAGKEINHRLLQALDKGVRGKLKKNVPANLTKLGLQQVLAHFYGTAQTTPNNDLEPAEPSIGPVPGRSVKNQPTNSLTRAGTSGAAKGRRPRFQSEVLSRRVGRQGLSGLNRGNVRRKPSARRTSPFKQMMRKQTISPAVAEAMRDRPEKGDKRRSAAQRKVSRNVATRIGKRPAQRP